MNYLKIEHNSISNGPGVRVVLWVSGCTFHCEGCHNPESWDFNAGKLFGSEAKQELFDALSKPWIRGITFSGGNPIERKTIFEMLRLVTEVKRRFPNKDIWLYTGWQLSNYNFSPEYLEMNISSMIFALCDVVVDGPYIEEQRDITLKFRGSKNQRLIDVKKTIEKKEIVLFDI